MFETRYLPGREKEIDIDKYYKREKEEKRRREDFMIYEDAIEEKEEGGEEEKEKKKKKQEEKKKRKKRKKTLKVQEGQDRVKEKEKEKEKIAKKENKVLESHRVRFERQDMFIDADREIYTELNADIDSDMEHDARKKRDEAFENKETHADTMEVDGALAIDMNEDMDMDMDMDRNVMKEKNASKKEVIDKDKDKDKEKGSEKGKGKRGKAEAIKSISHEESSFPLPISFTLMSHSPPASPAPLALSVVGLKGKKQYILNAKKLKEVKKPSSLVAQREEIIQEDVFSLGKEKGKGKGKSKQNLEKEDKIKWEKNYSEKERVREDEEVKEKEKKKASVLKEKALQKKEIMQANLAIHREFEAEIDAMIASSIGSAGSISDVGIQKKKKKTKNKKINKENEEPLILSEPVASLYSSNYRTKCNSKLHELYETLDSIDENENEMGNDEMRMDVFYVKNQHQNENEDETQYEQGKKQSKRGDQTRKRNRNENQNQGQYQAKRISFPKNKSNKLEISAMVDSLQEFSISEESDRSLEKKDKNYLKNAKVNKLPIKNNRNKKSDIASTPFSYVVESEGDYENEDKDKIKIEDEDEKGNEGKDDSKQAKRSIFPEKKGKDIKRMKGTGMLYRSNYLSGRKNKCTLQAIGESLSCQKDRSQSNQSRSKERMTQKLLKKSRAKRNQNQMAKQKTKLLGKKKKKKTQLVLKESGTSLRKRSSNSGSSRSSSSISSAAKSLVKFKKSVISSVSSSSSSSLSLASSSAPFNNLFEQNIKRSLESPRLSYDNNYANDNNSDNDGKNIEVTYVVDDDNNDNSNNDEDMISILGSNAHRKKSADKKKKPSLTLFPSAASNLDLSSSFNNLVATPETEREKKQQKFEKELLKSRPITMKKSRNNKHDRVITSASKKSNNITKQEDKDDELHLQASPEYLDRSDIFKNPALSTEKSSIPLPLVKNGKTSNKKVKTK